MGVSEDRLIPEVTQVAGEAVRELGMVIEDVAVMRAGSRSVVRILLDRDLSDRPAHDTTSPVEPLDLDQVAEASHAIGAAVDECEVMGNSPYVLEVSSIGVDRPLRTAAHFRRNVGRLVRVSTREDGQTAGRISAADQDAVSIDVPAGKAVPARTVRLRYDQIERAQVEVEFSRAGATGKDG